MIQLLLLMFMQDAPQAFTPQKDTVASLKAQLSAVREELRQAQEAIQQSREERQRTAAIPTQQENVLPFIVAGLASIDKPATNSPERGSNGYQWRIITADGCDWCKPLVNDIVGLLKDGFRIGAGRDDHFQIVKLTRQQWEQSGYTLPRAELWVDGKFEKERERPYTARGLADELQPANLVGVNVGTLPIKGQVEGLIEKLEPFLDGGKLTLTYTPRAGVVREWLIIQQGSYSLRIPSTTSLTIGCTKKELSGTFNGRQPEIKLPVRGNTAFKGFTASPAKFAIQFPWMFDPEWEITEGSLPDAHMWGMLRNQAIEDSK